MGRFKENQRQNQRSEVKNLMKIIAGVDEVGRGSLIGPVYASAVILKKSINPKLLKEMSLKFQQIWFRLSNGSY